MNNSKFIYEGKIGQNDEFRMLCGILNSKEKTGLFPESDYFKLKSNARKIISLSKEDVVLPKESNNNFYFGQKIQKQPIDVKVEILEKSEVYIFSEKFKEKFKINLKNSNIRLIS